MAHYQGTKSEGDRASRLAKMRESQREQFEKDKEQLKKDNESGLKSIGDMFASKDQRFDEQFRAQTVGLVSAEEYGRKRKAIEEGELRDKMKK
jgi:protein FAM50